MRIALLALALLAGCSGPIRVTYHFVDTEEELAEHCGESLMAHPLGCAKGGAMSTPDARDCDAYVLRPRHFDDSRRLETMGHEALHCYTGPKHLD